MNAKVGASLGDPPHHTYTLWGHTDGEGIMTKGDGDTLCSQPHSPWTLFPGLASGLNPSVPSQAGPGVDETRGTIRGMRQGLPRHEVSGFGLGAGLIVNDSTWAPRTHLCTLVLN